MKDIPPKTLRHRVQGRDGARPAPLLPPEAQEALARRGVALEGRPESLPVLSAFHEFLDTERRRTRNRILALTLFFLVLLAGVLSAAGFLGFVFFQQVRRDYEDVEADVADLRRIAETEREATRASVAQYAGETDALREALAADQTARASARLQMESGIEDLTAEFLEMRRLVRSLESENAALRAELGSLRQDWPAFSNVLESALTRLEILRLAGTAAHRLPALPPAEAEDSLRMTILPRGGDRPLAWRFPIPE